VADHDPNKLNGAGPVAGAGRLSVFTIETAESIDMTGRIDRRGFLLRGFGGIAGAVAGSTMISRRADALFGRKDTSEVSFVTGTDVREATIQALKPMLSDIERDVGDRQIVLKVNAGVGTPEAIKCSTDVEQIRGILDILRTFYDRQIIIAEGIASPAHSVMVSYENYNYLPLEKEYNVKLIDLNDEPFSTKYIIGDNYHPVPINIISTLIDPANYVISATRLKSHNAVIATLSLKNIAMGSPVCHYKQKDMAARNEKAKMHGGAHQKLGRELSNNLFRIAMEGATPDLAVLDAVHAIEGNGPWGGTTVEQGVVLAGTDFLAVDRVAVELMGIDYNEMKYLQWCGMAGLGIDNLDNIKVSDSGWRKHAIKYKLNKNADQQREWIYEED